jgi:TolB-like protein
MADPTGATEAPAPSDAQPVVVTADPKASASAGTWQRIKEHKILQWALGYLGAAIAIAHGQELMADAFDWPHVLSRILMSVLVLGFPLVLTIAWYHGHKGLKRIGPGEMTIVSFFVLIAAGLLVVLVRAPNEHAATQTTPVAVTEVPGSVPRPVTAPLGVSLAVLPFVDMSPEHNQEYFSDGLSEELLNQLAKIKELSVAGRTSSFSFKGKNEDLRVIGEKLGVNHLLEGSVRKDGKRLRITAQLINAANGTHLWSQIYDRELNDVFAVQEEIAKDVSGALSISLGVGEMSRVKGGTTSVEAYDKFLRARALRNRGVARADLLQSAQLFRETLALDPMFARAWSGLYDVLATTLIYVPEKTAATQVEMADASAHIVALAPDAWWTQTMRSDQFIAQHKWLEADVATSAALAAAPASDVQAIYAYSIFLWPVGRAKEAADLWARARLTDPLSLNVSYDLQIALCITGRSDELQAENQRSRRLSGDHASVDALAMQCLYSRRTASEPAAKAAVRARLFRGNTALYRSVAGKFDDPQAMRAELRKQFNDPINQDAAIMEHIAELAGQFGDKDLALAALRRSYIDLHRTNIGDIWVPWFSSLRSEPRFKDLLRDLKLVDYWRASGNWGDFCGPVGKDDFECH